MINVTIKGLQGIETMIDNIEVAPSVVSRACAASALGTMHARIHTDGKDATGNAIGTYSDAYMKVRTGNYGNSKRISKGKNKGNLLDAGTYTKGKNAYSNIKTRELNKRPNYKRSNDTKVIASLTGEMERSYAIIPTEDNGAGIGFTVNESLQKAKWLQEETYKKKIFALIVAEHDMNHEVAKETISNLLNNKNVS